MKYRALLFIIGCTISCAGNGQRRSSLTDFSQLYTKCIDILSSPIVMHVTCWIIGDKLVSPFFPFKSDRLMLNAIATLVGFALANRVRRKVSDITEPPKDRCFKKTSPELKIAAAYSLGTMGYAAASHVMPVSLQHYDKFNLSTLAVGILSIKILK